MKWRRRGVETTLACCVCGARAATAWRVASDNILGGMGRYRAVRCLRCDTARLDPRPSEAEMAQAYSSSTYARAEDENDSGLAERLDEYNRRLAERAAAGLAGTVPRVALDVGCGDGRFLHALRPLGWAVEGLETDPATAALARRRTGATIHVGALEDAPLAAGAFGLVSLLHVLEHVPDPRATLAAARRALAPGGRLLIAVPNAGSLEARLFRSVWYPLDLPRHYWGFNPHSLARLVDTSGFTVASIRHFPFLFAPQSIRYGLKALRGQPIADRVNLPESRGARGDLRTRAFLTLLGASEQLGRTLPGEVMELTATRSADG